MIHDFLFILSIHVEVPLDYGAVNYLKEQNTKNKKSDYYSCSFKMFSLLLKFEVKGAFYVFFEP